MPRRRRMKIATVPPAAVYGSAVMAESGVRGGKPPPPRHIDYSSSQTMSKCCSKVGCMPSPLSFGDMCL